MSGQEQVRDPIQERANITEQIDHSLEQVKCVES